MRRAPRPPRSRGWVVSATLLVSVVVALLVLPDPTHFPVRASADARPGAIGTAGTWPTLGDSQRPAVNVNSVGNWTNLTNLTGHSLPPGREFAGLTYDAADGYAVLFGGFNASGIPLGITWTMGANWTWSARNPLVSPTPRGGAAFAYDPSDQEVLLFGGVGANGTWLNDTWSFSGGVWQSVTSGPAPSGRGYPVLVPPPNGTGLMLFGGLGAAGALNDTWWFHNSGWTDLTPSAGAAPSPRWQAAATNLSAAGMDLLFGGNSSGGPLGDSWSFNATGWHHLLTANPPPPRAAAAMAFDQVDGAAVMYGGYSQTLGPLVTVSSFNGTGWGPAYTGSVHPHNRYGASLAWIGGFGGGVAMMFGGGSDARHLFQGTWAYASRLPLILGPPALSYPSVDTGYPVFLSANATGGVAPYSYQWIGLPGNCTQTATALVRCVPVINGVVASVFTVRFIVQDSTQATATSASASLKVNPTLVVDKLLFTPSPVTLGALLTIHVFAAGGQLPDRVVFTALPPGCASANVTTYTCRPAASGVFLVNVTVTDPFGMSASASNYIQVEAPASSVPLEQWALIAGAVLLVGVLAAVLWMVRRPRRGASPPPGATKGSGSVSDGPDSGP